MLLPDRKLLALLFILSIALSFALYYPSLSYPFLDWDDGIYIVNDPAIQHINPDNLVNIWTTAQNGVWYPLARTSHALDLYWFGANPFYHHAINILLHALDGFLLFILTSQLILVFSPRTAIQQRYLASGLGAFIFLLHPQHIEVVAWITQRNELLATLFFLLSMIFYVRFLGKNPQTRYAYFLSLAFSILASTAKPTAIGLAGVICSLDLAASNPTGSVSLLRATTAFRRSLPFALASFAVVIISFTTHRSINAFPLHDLYDPVQRICYASHNFFDFIRRFLAPVHLTPFVEFPNYIRNQSPTMFLPVVGFFLVFAICIFLAYRRRIVPLLILLSYVSLILPSSGLVLFGTYSASDRYMYMPSAALLAMIMLFTTLLAKENTERTSVLLAVIFIFFFIPAILFFRPQLAYWKNDLSLWRYTIHYQPDSGYPRVYLTEQLARHHLLTPDQAADGFSHAIAIEPVYAGFLGLAAAYQELGDTDKLIETHQRIIAQYPHHSAASKISLAILQSIRQPDADVRGLLIRGISEENPLCQQLRDNIEKIRPVYGAAADRLDSTLREAPLATMCKNKTP